MGYGAALKQARETQGLSTQDLALRTKIRGDYLRALEDGNVALLPERTFARSYLQRYARELGLDPAPLLAEFDRSVPPSAELSQALRGPAIGGRTGQRASPSPAARRTLRPAAISALATAVIVLGAGGYYALHALRTSAPAAASPAVPAKPVEPPAPVTTVRLTVSSVPAGARVYLDNRDLDVTPLRSFPVDARRSAQLRVEAAGRAPLKQTVDLTRSRNLRALLAPAGQTSTLVDLATLVRAPAPTTPAPGTPPPPTPGKPPAAGHGVGSTQTPPSTPAPDAAVTLTFSAPSWTRVTDAAGRLIYQGIPAAGSVKGFAQGVTVRTGNAGAVKVSVNGAAAQTMGQPGQVVSRTY